jgi:Spy/CpxP family protein refolding chaperone
MGQGAGMGGMMMGPLATFRPFEPTALLAQADRLGLDEEQVNRLTVLRDSTERHVEAAHTPAQAAMQGMRRELEAETPDTATIHQLLSAHMIAMGNMQWARLEAALKAREVLTDDQRTIVEEMTSDAPGGMQHRHGGGRER